METNYEQNSVFNMNDMWSHLDTWRSRLATANEEAFEREQAESEIEYLRRTR